MVKTDGTVIVLNTRADGTFDGVLELKDADGGKHSIPYYIEDYPN